MTMTNDEAALHEFFYFINMCLTAMCLLMQYYPQAIVAAILMLLLAVDLWLEERKREKMVSSRMMEEFRKY